MHGETPKGVTRPAIDGIIAAADDIAGDTDDPKCSTPRSRPPPRRWSAVFTKATLEPCLVSSGLLDLISLAMYG